MIAVIGSANLDTVYEVDHFTLPGETQTALSLNQYFGGKGANQAVAVAKITDSGLLFSTSIGDDKKGEEISKRFDRFKIEGYQIHNDTSSGRAFIEVNRKGENKIVSNPGANNSHSPDIVKRFLTKHGPKFNFCLIQNEIPKETIAESLRLLKEKNIKIIYDPATKEKTEIEWLTDVDYLTPNQTEFHYLKDKLKIKKNHLKKEALEFKLRSGVKNLILKRGSDYIIIVNNENEIIRFNTFKVKAVDTTAAGDIFNAGLAAALNNGLSLERACQFASAGAAVSVTRKGAQSSIPNRDEIDELLSSHDFEK